MIACTLKSINQLLAFANSYTQICHLIITNVPYHVQCIVLNTLVRYFSDGRSNGENWRLWSGDCKDTVERVAPIPAAYWLPLVDGELPGGIADARYLVSIHFSCQFRGF